MAREIRIEGSIAYVPLTQGYEAIVDASDVPLVSGRNWYAVVRSNTVYAASNDRPDVGGRRQVTVRMHRVISEAPVGLEVDHIDGNGLNNQRRNIRVASHAQNAKNRKQQKNNTSGVKGVTFRRSVGKWHARIQSDNKAIHLGFFGCRTAGHFAYLRAAIAAHGEFRRAE